MARGEDHRVEHQARHGARLVALLEDAGQAEIALALDVGSGESRTQHDVGREGHGAREGPLGRADIHGHGVPSGAGVECRAEVGHLGGKRKGVAGAGAFIQHVGGEGGEARPVAVEPGAAADDERGLNERDLVHRHHFDGEPVGQLRLLHHRHHQSGRGAERRLGGHGRRLGRERRREAAGQRERNRRPVHGVLLPVAASSRLPFGTMLSVTRGPVR